MGTWVVLHTDDRNRGTWYGRSWSRPGPSHDQLSVSDGRVPIERIKIKIVRNVKEKVQRKKIGGRPWSRRNIRPKRSTVPLSNKNRPFKAVKTSSPGIRFYN